MSRIARGAGLALTVAALGLLGFAPQDAYAGKRKKRTEKHELERPARAPDGDAEGVVRVTRRQKGDKFVVKLKNLDPNTEYRVVDADSGDLLGTVMTNKKGKAKLKMRAGAVLPGKDGDGVDGIAVFKGEDEAFVLVGALDGDEGDGPSTDPLTDAVFGDAFYGTLDAQSATISLFGSGDGYDSVFAGLQVRTGDGPGYFNYYADNVGDGALPLGKESVSDLAERAFDIVDADGDEVLAGELPELQDLDDLKNGDFEIDFPEIGDGEGEPETFAAPFTLRIADDLGELTEVGTFTSVDYGLPGDLESGCVFFGSYEGAHGDLSLFSDELGACITVSLFVPGAGEEDDVFAYWDQSTYGAGGRLPFGVDDLGELSGRDFELRNGADEAFVTGTVPDLSSDPFGTDWSRDDGEAIAPGAGPYTIWMENGDGQMEKIGELETEDWSWGGGDPGFPEDFEFGLVDFGKWDGAGGSLSMDQGGEYRALDVFLWIPKGQFDFELHELYLENGDVPFGAEDLGDLSGRKFELRNEAGDAFVTGELPEMSGFDGPFPGPGSAGGEAITPGDGPYTLWIADAEGTLTKIGSLKEYEEGNVFFPF